MRLTHSSEEIFLGIEEESELMMKACNVSTRGYMYSLLKALEKRKECQTESKVFA